MSWTLITNNVTLPTVFPKLSRSSDTYFSPISQKFAELHANQILKNKRSFVTLDTEKSYLQAEERIRDLFGTFIRKTEKSYVIRGILHLVKTNVSHHLFGMDLDMFTISNPFITHGKVFAFFEHGKIKIAGLFGEGLVSKLENNTELGVIHVFCEQFFSEEIIMKIPRTIQDLTDFDEVFTKRLQLESRTTSIKIGNDKEITSLQKFWLPSISGETIAGQTEGINAYTLTTHQDSGSRLKEQLDYLINFFQPYVNTGPDRFNSVDFNVQRVEQTAPFLDPTQRDLFKTSFFGGFRATVGTVISGIEPKRTKECVEAISFSENIDYVNLLQEMSVPTNLQSSLNKEKQLAGDLRYHLLCLRVLPVCYVVQDVKDILPQDLRMALAFSKSTPYLLDPKNDDSIIPQRLKDQYITAVSLFKKENTQETRDFIADVPLLKG